MRYFRHTLEHHSVSSNTDEAIAFAAIPSESNLNGCQGEVHVQGVANEAITSVSMYGCDAWLIPVGDPDTPDLIDDLWDRFVEKDFDLISGSFDLDTASPDTQPFDEPGTHNTDRIASIEALEQSQRFFRRRKILSFVTGPRGFIDAAPDSYNPGDFFKVRTRRNMHADVPSVAVFGFGSPDLADTTVTHPSSPTETEWLQIKYMEVVLEQAWMDLAGLTEAGAETPWEEAVALIADQLEPNVVEDTAAAFKPTAYNVWCQMTFDITVPGRRDFTKALTAAS